MTNPREVYREEADIRGAHLPPRTGRKPDPRHDFRTRNKPWVPSADDPTRLYADTVVTISSPENLLERAGAFAGYLLQRHPRWTITVENLERKGEAFKVHVNEPRLNETIDQDMVAFLTKPVEPLEMRFEVDPSVLKLGRSAEGTLEGLTE